MAGTLLLVTGLLSSKSTGTTALGPSCSALIHRVSIGYLDPLLLTFPDPVSLGMDENPSLIQGGRVDEGLSDIPIFLIHDGGGTTFSYFCLGPLNRHVYGIHNPRFSSGHGWEGGMKELAAEYAELVQSVVPRGKVLLGGTVFFFQYIFKGFSL